MQTPKSLEEYIEILERFNEKIEDLFQCSGFINSNRIGVCFHYPGEIERYGPKEESIYAVVAILRFFLNKNEDTSIRKMKEHYDKMLISENVKDEFYKMKDKINSFLNAGSGTLICFEEGGKEVDSLVVYDNDGKGSSRREILEIFRFGHYEHMNDSKRRRQFASIKDVPENRALIERLEFIPILRRLIGLLPEIKEINCKALAELKNNI